MPLLLTAIYVLVNVAISAWMFREEARRGHVSLGAVRVGWVARWGPPLLGLAYLVTVANDWPFFLFVVFFFLFAFYLLDRLLNYPEGPPPPPWR